MLSNFHSRISLWVYVFGLLAIFLLVLASAQLIFINHIESQINREISNKTTFLTNRAIKIAVEERLDVIEALVELTNTDTQTVVLREQTDEVLKDAQDENKKLNRTTSFSTVRKYSADNSIHNMNVIVDGTITRDLNRDVETVDVIRKVVDIHEGLKEIRVEPLEDNVFVFSTSTTENRNPAMTVFDSDASTVSEYFKYLSYGTFASALLSLIFALWLSRHVTQPLTRLSKGFQRLSAGELGYTLPLGGVKEVRETISKFNETSSRLKELKGKEEEFTKKMQLAELGEVSRGMAHSLRNPLNTIGLALEEMAQDNSDIERKAHIASQARKKIQSLDNIIKSLLSFTTTEIDRNQIISVNQMIDDIAMQKSTSEGCRVIVSAEKQIQIKGSELELSAVINSLVSNAEEACKPPCEILIDLTTTENEAVLKVIDHGTGLPAKISDRLFKPHVTTKPEGAGMGLYIAKRILNLHYKGDIILKNNDDKGCCATITLPLISDTE